VKGEYNRLISFYRANHPFMPRIALKSPGGDVQEAIKIGSFLMKYLITADAPTNYSSYNIPPFLTVIGKTVCQGQDCICASSCALIWFGAPERFGQVGLHRPKFEGTEFKNLTAGEAERVYKPALASMSKYLEEMEVSKVFIEAMVTTSSSEIRWTGSDEFGVLYRSPSFAEWLQANCRQYGSLSEQKDIIELEARQANLDLTQHEKQLLELLRQRLSQRWDCENNLTFGNREKLAPPSVRLNVEDLFSESTEKSQSRLAPDQSAAESQRAIPKGEAIRLEELGR
jgi:hypothetical protein